MSTGFLILLGISVLFTGLGIAAASIHADMLMKKGNAKGEIGTIVANTAVTVTILGLVIAMLVWPFRPTWSKCAPMDSVYKLTASFMHAPSGNKDIKGAKPKDVDFIYHTIRLVFIASIYSLVWGLIAQNATKSMSKGWTSGSGGGGKNKQPRSPWSNRPY